MDGSKFDESNALVLPDKKSTAQKSAKNKNASKGKTPKPVLLSKKKRKKLEKVLERKGKKLNVSCIKMICLFQFYIAIVTYLLQRAKLISDLQQFQVKDKEFEMMPSTSIIQTAGRKRFDFVMILDYALNLNLLLQT